MRRLSIAALGVLITACSPVLPVKPNLAPDIAWQQRHQQVAALDSWQIEGRTAIRQGKESWNAGLAWNQNKSVYEIKILGPFSQGGAVLNGDGNHVTMKLDDGRVLSASSPEKLIFESLGITMPVSALRSWIKGIPYAELAVDSLQYDEQGRLTHLNQSGWDIEYKRYIPFESYSMPAKIFIKHADLSLRLIISDWDPAQ